VARVLLADLERVWRGGQEQALLLMIGLQRRGHGVELVAVRDAAIALRAQAAGIRVHAVSDSLRRMGAALRIRKLIAGEKRFDIVHANEAHALTAAWLGRSHRRVPLVVARRVAFPLSRGRISRARWSAAAKILAVSEAARNQLLAAGLAADRIAIVADGVDIPGTIPTVTREKARQRWGFAAEQIVLECVAALTPEKGHALLIEAFAKLRRGPGGGKLRLLLAGDGRLRQQLEQRAREAGVESSVLFAGFVPDVEAVYAAGDLFVFPSLLEGAGSSLLRAMAFGLPAVALERGGVGEIIQDGKNGVLAREATPEALAQAIERMLSEPASMERLSRAGRETVAERYSADRMIEATERIFEELIAERGGNR
jgi:glycosyltransferase involved in cell wall biosynthesis